METKTNYAESLLPTREVVGRASFGDRFFAAFVDNIIVQIPLRIAFIFLVPLWSNPYFSLFFSVCVELVMTLLYFAVFAYRRGGQTWGKKWNNVKVTDLQGNDLTTGHFIVREFIARGIPIVGSIFFGLWANLWIVTYLLALSNSRRALHDVIVGTQVVKVK